MVTSLRTSLRTALTLLLGLLMLCCAHVAAASPAAARLAILYQGQNERLQALVDLVEGRVSRLKQSVVLGRTRPASRISRRNAYFAD